MKKILISHSSYRKGLSWLVVLMILLPILTAVSREEQASDTNQDVVTFQHRAISEQQKSASGDSGYTIRYDYNEQGRLVGVDYGDSTVIIYSYDNAGNLLSRVIKRGSLRTGDVETETPLTYELAQNYPNPFNPITTIRYQIPKKSHVTLTIYNILGQEIRILVNDRQDVGTYSIVWDGRDQFDQDVSSGIFFCRMIAGQFVQTMKMIILK